MKKTNIIALFAAAGMTIGGLSACGTGKADPAGVKEPVENATKDQETGDGKKAAGDQKTAGDQKVAGKGATEVPTIDIYNNSGAFSAAGAEAGSDGAAYQMMQDYILEQTGVKVEIIMPPSDSSSATEKLNLLLAGGDQIDAWWGDWGDYASDGMILPLTDYVKSAEGKALYDLWEPWGSWNGVTDSKGAIWAVPRMTDTTPYPIFVRNDWLDLVGMKMPQTMDELNEYLYKIKKLDPYGNGETIPLLLEKGGSGDVLGRVEYALLGGYVKTGKGLWLDKDGKVKPEWMADGYTDFLKQLHKWYQDGIIHKESFTMDVDTIRQDISKGVVGSTAVWYSRVTISDPVVTKNLKNFDTKKHDYVFGISDKGITGPNGGLIQTKAKGGNNGLVISSKCKNPDAVMKFVEWSFDWNNYTDEMYGLEGKYWEYNPDIPDAKKNKAVRPINGAPTYARDFLVSLGLPLEVQTTEYDEWGRQSMDNYWLQHHLDDFDTTIEPGIEGNITWDKQALSENIPTLNDLNTYKDEELIKFINGTRDLSTWNKFIDECYGMGLNDYINEYTRQYQELQGKK